MKQNLRLLRKFDESVMRNRSQEKLIQKLKAPITPLPASTTALQTTIGSLEVTFNPNYNQKKWSQHLMSRFRLNQLR